MADLKNNTQSLETILNKVEFLPIVEMPILTNPGEASDISLNKEFYDSYGNKVVGTHNPITYTNAEGVEF